MTINFCRSLLLAQPGSSAPDPQSYPGEEFVEAPFIPRPMPAQAGRVWTALFGTNPDRPYLNYRLRQLMAVAHSGPFRDRLTADDPRLTYWPVPDRTADYARWAAYGSVTILPAGPSLPVQLGIPVADDATGRCYSQWRVDTTVSGPVTITREDSPGSFSMTPSYSAGLSSPVALPGSGLSFLFPGPSTASWAIDALARPEDLGPVLYRASSSLNPEDVNYICTLADPTLSASLQYAWTNGNSLGLKLGALTTALALKLALLRQGGSS